MTAQNREAIPEALRPEPAPVKAPLDKPKPLEPGSDLRHAFDRFAESKIAAHTLESAPQFTRVSPVFELASVGHGRAQELVFSQHDSMLAGGSLKSNIDGALALIVSRLDDGDSLITTHSFHPQSSGCMGVSTRFYVEHKFQSKCCTRTSIRRAR